MSAPVFKETFATFGAAVGLHKRTVRNLVDRGEVRCVRFGSGKKPIVRLEPPADYLARQGRYSDPEPEPEPVE